MSRVLRGAWSRRGALTTLVLMALVVVAGAVTVLQFAEAAGTSRWLTAPLLLLGAVAVPSIGAELAVARREEIGLARLRGIHGVRLWRFLLVEPLLAIVVGTLLGVAVGAAGTVVATRTWLGEAADPLRQPALVAAAAIAGAALVIVGLSAAAALREPLSVQVSTRRRPRRATTLAVFLSVLVLVGAGVAAYRSREASGDPDLVVLLGPALVGLALGQAAIWAIRIAARGLTPVTERRGMGAFLAARRLARADDLVTPVRLVVAAAVVGALALSGAVSVSRWTEEQAGVEVPGARTIVATEVGAMGAVGLTERVDPEGDHLIATAIVRNEGRLAERRAYVDAGRWDAVVGGFYDGTPERAASDAVERLATGAVPLQVTGDRLTVAATATTLPPPQVFTDPDGTEIGPSTPSALVVRLSYVNTDNVSGTATATVRFARKGVRTERSVRLRDCAVGCLVTGLEVSRDLSGVYTIDPLKVRVERDRRRRHRPRPLHVAARSLVGGRGPGRPVPPARHHRPGARGQPPRRDGALAAPQLVPPPHQRVTQHRRAGHRGRREGAAGARPRRRRTHDRRPGHRHRDADPREHRGAVRHPHVGRRLRPDRAGR